MSAIEEGMSNRKEATAFDMKTVTAPSKDDHIHTKEHTDTTICLAVRTLRLTD